MCLLTKGDVFNIRYSFAFGRMLVRVVVRVRVRVCFGTMVETVVNIHWDLCDQWVSGCKKGLSGIK